jgi:hypothetical protein
MDIDEGELQKKKKADREHMYMFFYSRRSESDDPAVTEHPNSDLTGLVSFSIVLIFRTSAAMLPSYFPFFLLFASLSDALMFVEFIPSFQSNWVNGNETAL